LNSDAARWTRLPPPVLILVAARAVNRLGAFSLAFLPVLLVQVYDAGLATAGLVMSAFGVATIPSRLAGGVLADRFGRRTTIAIGLLGCAIAQLALAAAPGLGAATGAAVALGLAFELYEPPSQALVADLTPPRLRPVAFGLLGAALAVAGMGAGLVAAAVGAVDLRWLFVVDAVTCLACAALVLAALPRDRPAASGGGAAGVLNPWTDRRLLAMLAAGSVFATVYMAAVVGLPLTLLARGLPPSRAGLLLTVSAVTAVAGQRLLRIEWEGFVAMRVGYAVLAAGLFATGLATSMPALAAAAVLTALGDVLLLGHVFAIVSGLADERSRASYLAAYGVSWGVGTIAAPVLVTVLLEAGGPPLMWGVAAAASLGLVAVQPVLRWVTVSPDIRGF
jgi:MFS family permease